jgi:prolipoprotein diacylglyceryltransferase
MMEFTLLGAAVIAALTLYGVLRFEAGRTNAADCTRNLWDSAIGAAALGLVAGRLAAMIGGGTNPFSHPGDILIVRGGVDTGVAAAAALAVLGILARKDLWRTFDGLAAASLGGLAGWHAGCLIRGGCLGTASDLPWAVARSGSEVTRHPVEIYAALALTGAVIGLILWKRRRPIRGMVAGAALALAGAVRLVTEPMRLTIGGGPEAWYAAAIVAGIAVVGWRMASARRPPAAI